MTTQGRPWGRYSGEGDVEIAQQNMQPDQGGKTARLGDSRNQGDDWWSINSMPDKDIPQVGEKHNLEVSVMC